jgi:hypothetical protein
MPRGSFVSRPANFGQPADAQVDQFATWSMSENLKSLTLEPAPNPILLVLVLVFFPEVPYRHWSIEIGDPPGFAAKGLTFRHRVAARTRPLPVESDPWDPHERAVVSDAATQSADPGLAGIAG